MPSSDDATATAGFGVSERTEWCDLLYRIAAPVLSNLAAGTLKKNMPLELSPIWDGRDRNVAYLECFGRLMAGLAPWLALPEDDSAEGGRRRQLTRWALAAIANAVDPGSPDYLLWRGSPQALVDSAYFTQALMRAPRRLWQPLDAVTKARIVEEVKGLRRINPAYTNWLLFAALNEAFLLSIGEAYDPMRVSVSLRKFQEWYVGDGWYSDGERFHLDYYNSFVIHPMLIDILEAPVRRAGPRRGAAPNDPLAQAIRRCQRFCEHLERMIGPDGAFPPIGRSITYRTAAFQPLALMAWRKSLPEALGEGRVRAALTAVHRAIFASPTNFTADGFLTLGFAGHQPSLADSYSNNGSMYLTTASFLPLGLPAGDTFWTAPAEAWTMKRAFTNAPFAKDYPVSH